MLLVYNIQRSVSLFGKSESNKATEGSFWILDLFKGAPDIFMQDQLHGIIRFYKKPDKLINMSQSQHF